MLFKAEIGAVSRAACQVQGVWVAPAHRGRGIGTAGTAAVVEYARADDRPGRQPVRQRLQRRRPCRLPPGRLPRGRAVRQRAVLRDRPEHGAVRPSDSLCAVRTRRGPASRHRAPAADRCPSWPPAPAAPRTTCGGAAEAFLDDWAGGDAAAAAAATTDPDVGHRAARADRRPTCPTRRWPPSSATVDRRGRRRPPSDWTATWDLAAAPDWTYDATLRLEEGDDGWQVVAEPTLVHPELGEGQHLELARSLPERAADHRRRRARRCSPRPRSSTSASTPAQVTDLPALAAGAVGGHRHPGRGHRRRRPGRPRRASSSRSSPCAGRTSRRSAPRCSTCPARSSRPTPGCWRRRRASPRRCWAGSARRPPRSSRSRRGRRRRGTPPATSSASPGLQRAFQEQLTGTAGFTVSVVSTDESTGDEGREIAAVEPVPGEPVQTPLVPAVQNAADAAVAGAAAGHAPRRRPARHRRDPRGLLQRGGRRRQRAGRPVPARLEHEDDHRDRAALGRCAHPRHPRRLPGDDGRRGPRVREPGPVRPGHRAVHRGVRAVVQHDLHPAGAAAARRRRWPRRRRPTGWAPTGSCRSTSSAAACPATAPAPPRPRTRSARAQVLMSPAQMALVAAGIASGTPAAPVEVVGAEPAGPAPAGPGPAGARRAAADDAAGRRSPGPPPRWPTAARSTARPGRRSSARNTPPDSHGWFVGYQLGGAAGRHRLRRPGRGRAVQQRGGRASPTPSSARWAERR